MRAANTSVLRKTDSTVREELTRLDLSDRGFNQTTVLMSLLVRDGCFQVLNFRKALPHEDNNRDIRNSADPGLANHLGIE
jgi:hypothetical protein